jgi:hypothetical protein
MSKARDLADFVSDGSPLADGTISVSEVSGAAPTASPTFTGTVTASTIDVDTLQNTSGTLYTLGDLNFRSSSGVTPLANFAELGSVTLYYNGSEKIKTVNTGVTVTGTVYTTGLDVTNVVATNVDATTIDATSIEASTSLAIGNNDTGNSGVLYLYGGATGEGGELRIYPSAAEDTVIDNWSIDVATDDLRFFTSAGTVAYQLAPTGAASFGSMNNYGTSGQVLTSGGSGAAPTWADAAGGGTVELTAASDISVGDRIRIKTSTGEVEPIQYRNISDDGDTQINSSVSNNDRFTGATYVGNNKYVAIYGNNSDSDYPYYNVITVASDGTYTIGTSTRIGTFTCFPVGSISYHRFHVASNGDGEVVLYFENGTSSGLKTITGTVSGSSITWGSVQTVQSTNPFAGDICYDSTNNLYFLLYTDSAGASKVKTASSNGSNTLTFSSATTWYYPATATKYMSATYNVDQGNVEVYYSDKDDQNNVKGRTLTYSGGSITVSSAVQIDYIGTENQDGVYANYVSEQGYTVIMSMQTSPSRAFSILVVSNSSGALTLEYTYNAQHSFNSDTHYNTFYDPVSESQLFLYSDGSGTCYLKQYVWNISTTQKLSLETDINLFSSDRMMGGNGFYDANSGTTFLIFSKGPSYGATPTITKFTTKIAKVSDFIGFADEAISAGSAGKITTIGGLTTNQSGLSAGSVYYINTSTGALTTSSSGSTKIGKALSSTSILIQSVV